MFFIAFNRQPKKGPDEIIVITKKGLRKTTYKKIARASRIINAQADRILLGFAGRGEGRELRLRLKELSDVMERLVAKKPSEKDPKFANWQHACRVAYVEFCKNDFEYWQEAVSFARREGTLPSVIEFCENNLNKARKELEKF